MACEPPGSGILAERSKPRHDARPNAPFTGIRPVHRNIMIRSPHHASFLASIECGSAQYPGLDRAEKFPIERLAANADTFRRSRASHRYRKAVRKNILELPTVRGAITSYHHRGFDWALPRVLPLVLLLGRAICCEPPPPP